MDESRFVGCIAGLAIGDALGYPAEFRTRQDLIDVFGDAGITDFVALRDPRLALIVAWLSRAERSSNNAELLGSGEPSYVRC